MVKSVVGALSVRSSGSGAASVAAALLPLAAVYGLAQAVLQPINQLTRPGGEVLVNAPYGTLDPTLGNGSRMLPPGTHIELATDSVATLHVAELPGWLQVVSEAEHIVPGLVLFAAALLLRKVLISVAVGRPFDPRNPRRLTGLAAVLALGSVAGSLAVYWSTRVVLNHVGIDISAPDGLVSAPSTGPELDGLWLALLALAAAAAFRRGSQLADDTDGLV